MIATLLRSRSPRRVGLLALLFSALFLPAWAADPVAGDMRGEVKARVDQALRFLRDRQKDGRWMHPGVTALCLQAFLTSQRHYRSEDGPFIRLPLEYLAGLQQPDGGIYDPALRSPSQNYCTSLAVMALVTSGEERFKPIIAKARDFLVGIQADEGEGYDAKKDFYYGGIGYGSAQRPDLSNLQFALEAVKAAGLEAQSPTFKKALVFLQRCQDAEGNDLGWAKGSGGFLYCPDPKNNKSFPKNGDPGGVNAYGSMTFAGIKSLILCGVPKDDPRVQEALRWVRRNFTLTEHPGMGQMTVYYYYLTLARTLALLGLEEVELEGKGVVPWRKALAEELLKRQRADGSWVNDEKKEMEDVSELATAYAVNALNFAYP